MLTYRYYRDTVGHTRFTAFMLAGGWVGRVRYVLTVIWYALCGLIGWKLG